MKKLAMYATMALLFLGMALVENADAQREGREGREGRGEGREGRGEGREGRQNRFGGGRGDRMMRDDGAPKVGEMAPLFKLGSLDGKSEMDLKSFAGKRPVVLIFGSYT